MTDCIICFESFSPGDIITSTCSHGPYCHTCYNNITSPINPTCAICRGPLTRSNNPNPRYANNNNNNNLYNDFNLPYIVVDVINQGTYQVNHFNNHMNNQVNNQVNNHGANGFTTPPSSPRVPELTQERIYNEYKRRTGDIGIGTQFSQMMIGPQ